MIETDKYDFTFTASSLRLTDMVLVANASLENRQIDFVNELGGGKSATGKRLMSEFSKRLSTLTKSQVDVLIHGDLNDQKHIALLSVCKRNKFIRDFIIEVVREKVLLFDFQITEGDYVSFYRRKFELHPEMEKLTLITEKKIRQVTFKILEQAGIIDNIKTRRIQPQIIDKKVIDAIKADNPNWLKILLLSDADIKA